MVLVFFKNKYIKYIFKKQIEITKYYWKNCVAFKRKLPFCYEIFSEEYLWNSFQFYFLFDHLRQEILEYFLFSKLIFQNSIVLNYKLKYILFFQNIQITELEACSYSLGLCCTGISLSNTLRKATTPVFIFN